MTLYDMEKSMFITLGPQRSWTTSQRSLPHVYLPSRWRREVVQAPAKELWQRSRRNHWAWEAQKWKTSKKTRKRTEFTMEWDGQSFYFWVVATLLMCHLHLTWFFWLILIWVHRRRSLCRMGCLQMQESVVQRAEGLLHFGSNEFIRICFVNTPMNY